MFLWQVQQASLSSQLRQLRLSLPPTRCMEHSYPLQHRHPGSMLKEAASFKTMSMLSTTSSSFQSTLNLMFMNILSMNILRILPVTLDCFGAVISPSLTRATAPLREWLDVALKEKLLVRMHREVRFYLIKPEAYLPSL